MAHMPTRMKEQWKRLPGTTGDPAKKIQACSVHSGIVSPCGNDRTVEPLP